MKKIVGLFLNSPLFWIIYIGSAIVFLALEKC